MGEKKVVQGLWSVDDVIAYLNVPRTSVFVLVSQGKIPSIKIGRKRRFIPEEVERAIKKFPR